MKKHRLLILGVCLVTIGMVALYLENRFYRYMDEDGFIVESFFLPVGILAFSAGLMVLLFVFMRMLWKLVFSQK